MHLIADHALDGTPGIVAVRHVDRNGKGAAGGEVTLDETTSQQVAARMDGLPAERVRPALHACLASTEWVETMLAGRPHGDVAGWLAAGDAAFDALSDSAVLIALQAHPRIGESPTGGGADAAASRREQHQMGAASDDVRVGIAAGNRAYEERFDRVFLIRAAGRPPHESLAELRRRLANDDETELAEARAQLRQITALRLEQALTPDPSP